MKDNKIDVTKVNEVVGLSKKILKILYITLIMAIIYVSIIILKETKIFDFILTILGVCLPVFIGLLIAWLFDPLVRWMQKKGIRRWLGTGIIYVLFITLLSVVIGAIVPVIAEQINDLVSSFPIIFEKIKLWTNELFDKLNKVDMLDAEAIKQNIFSQLEEFGTNLASSLPTMLVNIVKGLFSGIGTFLIGLIIGFFLLVSFNDTGTMIAFLPNKMKKTTEELLDDVNSSLRTVVIGTIIDCTAVFLISSLGLWLAGLKAPLLFGLFCGLTNVIPYAGPYIGGAPAVIVGFSMSPTIGVLSLIVIAVIQGIEGNLLQPMIMSKTTKIHPVTIIIGLLIFGHFWGIIGMIVATPLITTAKTIFLFYDEKYDLLKW